MNQKNAPWLLLLASAMWGSSFVASKICLNGGLLQFEAVFFRFALATVLSLLLFWKDLRRTTKKALRAGVVVGITTVGSYTLEMFGLTLTQTTKAAFLTTTNIVMMPFLYLLFCGVRPKLKSLAAAVLAMTGVGFLSLTEGFGTFAVGDALLLCDALFYGLNSIAVLKLAGEESRIQITFYQFLTTAVVMGLLSVAQGFSGNYTAPVLGAVLYQATIPTVACFLIKNLAIKYMDPVRCTLILATESVFCALVSRLVFQDVLTLRMWLGVVLIAAGVLVEILEKKPKTAAA